MPEDSVRHVLIDTDPGIDDALALLLAWSSPEWSVDVLTTVAGNVPVDVGTLNVFRLLDLRRPSPVPVVVMGAAKPLARELETAAQYHGEDGMGELSDWPTVESRPAPGEAAPAIVETARRLRGELTLVALGPLTNLALAAELDPAALSSIGRVVAMGGAVDVRGNVTGDAEFNAHCDPEAFARVLDAGVRVDLVPLDATRQAILERPRSRRRARGIPARWPTACAASPSTRFASTSRRASAAWCCTIRWRSVWPSIHRWRSGNRYDSRSARTGKHAASAARRTLDSQESWTPPASSRCSWSAYAAK
jgi:inosine-uridine nucleoside N-ribohydrolase